MQNVTVGELLFYFQSCEMPVLEGILETTRETEYGGIPQQL